MIVGTSCSSGKLLTGLIRCMSGTDEEEERRDKWKVEGDEVGDEVGDEHGEEDGEVEGVEEVEEEKED